MHIVERIDASREAGTGRGLPSLQVTQGARGADHRETSETYRGELFRLGRYRVAICRDGLQWLYQRRRPGFAGVGAAWDTLGYCVTRDALIRLHRSHTGRAAPEITALPERFDRRGPK